MQRHRSILRLGKTGPSSHTVNRPLRVPGQRVIHTAEPTPAADKIGRGGQVLPRELVVQAAPYEIDLARFEPPPPPVVDEAEEEEVEEQPTEEELRAAALAEAVAVAREEAYKEGYESARAELQAEFEEKAAALRDDAVQMHEENTRFLERTEVLLVDLAFRIAGTVLDSPLLAPARDAAKDAVATAIERLAGAHSLRVRVHPVDYLRLQEAGLIDQLSAAYADLRWEPDASLVQGDWSVESPDAVIRHFEREMLSDLRERLGLVSVALPEPTGDAE